VYLTFAAAAAGVTALVLHQRSVLALDPGQNLPPRYLVLMVLDGAQPADLTVGKLPHLDALRAAGTQYTNAFDGILEAETPAGHATISTGSRPDHNGILGFDWSTANARYSLFSPDQMASVEQILQNSGAPTIGSLYKKQYPHAVVVALSGHKYYAAAPLGGPAADAIMYYQGDPNGRYVPTSVPGHVPPASVLAAPGLTTPTIHLPDGAENHLATELALSAVARMHPRILLINYPEFDWPLGHVDGGLESRSKVATDMTQFDTDLGLIESAYRRAGVLGRTLFAITADHGMMPVSHFIPSSVVDNAVSAAGTTAPDIASSSADYIWLADQTKAQAVAQNIMNAHESGIQSAYYLAGSGAGLHYISAVPGSVTPALETANQYLLDALLNGHQPTVVVFGHEGATFTSPTTGWKADHGGNSWESQHIPLVLSGPGILRGVTVSAPAALEDVAPTVLTDMGVAPRGMEGHALTDALEQSSQSQQRARVAEAGQLTPIQEALTSASAAGR